MPYSETPRLPGNVALDAPRWLVVTYDLLLLRAVRVCAPSGRQRWKHTGERAQDPRLVFLPRIAAGNITLSWPGS